MQLLQLPELLEYTTTDIGLAMLLLVQDLEFLALNWLMLFFPLFRGRFFVIHYQIHYSFPSTVTAVRELHWSIVTNKNLAFQFCLTKNI